jgi:23S rRNA (uracil1939-C5)-methyltransferase
MRRSRRNKPLEELITEVTTTKLVHGGQALGVDTEGKTTFVWGALPGEKVSVRITKNKKSWAEGIVEEVIDAAKFRIAPEEPEVYLGTSPWQIMGYAHENTWKQTIIEEVFAGEKLELTWAPFVAPKDRYSYRNKMEYNFWWNEGRIDLALHARGSHRKIAVVGSKLASDAINEAGIKLVEFLNKHEVGGKDIKSAIIRSTVAGEVGMAVYLKERATGTLPWADIDVSVLRVYYSEPKSPASVPTDLLLNLGGDQLTDTLLKRQFSYSVEGFFQVNVPVYEEVIKKMKKFVTAKDDVVDMYAGVGSIGMSLPHKTLVSVELDKFSSEQAAINAGDDKSVKTVLGESEDALDYIEDDKVIIVDPPRAGLHQKVINQLNAKAPKKVLYLSCDPSTQARDVRLLVDGGYKVIYAGGYNFFPATPHIESLIVLER